MKKLVITALALAGFSFVSAGKKINVSKCDPSKDGTYEKVDPRHDSENDIHTLSCFNPGDKACKWDHSPWELTTLNQIDETVTSQVQKGELTGTFTLNGAIVNWDAVEVNNFNYTINVE